MLKYRNIFKPPLHFNTKKNYFFKLLQSYLFQMTQIFFAFKNFQKNI